MTAKSKAKLFFNSISLSVLSLLSVFFMGIGSVSAATPALNNVTGDLKTLRLGNYTTDLGTQNWAGTITSTAGQRIAVDVYYHNTVEGTTANNLRLRVSYPSGSSTQKVLTATILSDNANLVTDTAVLNINSAQTIAFESNARWLPNQQTSSNNLIPVTDTGSYVEVNIGNIAGGWPYQGHVFFYLNISNNSVNPGNPNTPIVNAGPNSTVNSGATVNFNATATDPNNLPLTLAWTCNGGGVTNATILTPIYNAPTVSITTTYACTLTATNTNGLSGTGVTYISVLGPNGGGSGGSGGGGPDLTVSLSANPASGTSPLNGVDLVATVSSVGISSDYPVRYSFDCENNNNWDLKVETNNTSYTAAHLCNYFYDDTYTAKVKVERDGLIAYAQTKIYVGQKQGSNGFYGISVDAGPSKDIGKNQSVILNGSAYSQLGYALTYYWTCNGGNLSNTNTLTPTYYAPSVNSDITYTCTLYATDTRGYRNSDTVNIIVRNTGNSGYNTSGLSVTTNTPTNVTGYSATLNGTVVNDGGQATSTRFNWGKLSSYNNFTSWAPNQFAGQTFYDSVSGLEKGKAYHYRVEASNGREVVVGTDVAFVTKPDAPMNFTATGVSSNQINLNWSTGAASCYTMVVRKAGSYPTSSADGKTVYYGTGNSFVDSSLSNGVWYYYRAWSVACDEGLYSFSDGVNSRAYTTAGTGQVVTPVANVETGASVDALARDVTQNEIAWQNSVTASPSDQLEFKVIITPTGGKSLENVVLKANLSDKISSIDNIKIDGEAYNGSLSNDVNLGTVALGETKTITFNGKLAGNDTFSFGSNDITNAFTISAKDVSPIVKNVAVSVSRSAEAGAGLISFLDLRVYSGILTALFLIMCVGLMYLLIERKKGKQILAEKEAAPKVEKVEKSKYFNIK